MHNLIEKQDSIQRNAIYSTLSLDASRNLETIVSFDSEAHCYASINGEAL